MIIEGITYSSFNYSFHQPIITAKQILSARKGFIVKLIAKNRNCTFGECSPLPEFGSEDLIIAEKSLQEIVDKLKNFKMPENHTSIQILLDELNPSPSVRFALEQSFYEMLIKNDNSFRNNFPGNKRIAVNGLVSFSNREELHNKLKEAEEKGYSRVKVKITSNRFSEELNILNETLPGFPDLIYRIDVNGAWSGAEAEKNISLMQHLPIEYIEQPVSSLDDLESLAETSGIPIAADESIRTPKDAERIINGNIPVLVIKPMLIGGLAMAKKLAEEALGKDKKVIISSGLETNIGRRFLVFIATLVNSDFHHGLSTSNIFIEDKIKDPFPVVNGYLHYSYDSYREYLLQAEYD